MTFSLYPSSPFLSRRPLLCVLIVCLSAGRLSVNFRGEAIQSARVNTSRPISAAVGNLEVYNECVRVFAPIRLESCWSTSVSRTV